MPVLVDGFFIGLVRAERAASQSVGEVVGVIGVVEAYTGVHFLGCTSHTDMTIMYTFV
jgi:hypothetical protein